jgi:hypothetical protein
MEMRGQLHVPAALPPGKESLVSRTGLNTVVKRKIPSSFPGFEPPIIQLVVQRYTTELSWHLDFQELPMILRRNDYIPHKA